MSRRPPTDQISLFDPPDQATAPVAPAAATPATTGRRRHDGSPQRAAELLAEVQDGWYAAVDDTDRIVIVEDVTGSLAKVRYAIDEDAITTLIGSGCVERRPPRDNLSALHGVIRKTVTPLRLTAHGRAVCARWNAFAPIGAAPRPGGADHQN